MQWLAKAPSSPTAKKRQRANFVPLRLAAHQALQWSSKHIFLAALCLLASACAMLWLYGRAFEALQLSAGLRVAKALYVDKDVIPILIPVYGRPHYLRRVLSSLAAARGIEKTLLVFSQDGSNHEITREIESIAFAAGVVHLQHRQPYLNIPSMFLRTDAPTAANVRYLLRFAFDYLQAPAAIVLESDIELAPDGIGYFEWAYARLARSEALQQRVFTVNGFNEASNSSAGPYDMSTSRDGFMVWGWLCPHWSWPLINSRWTWFGNWDINMENNIRRPLGKVSLSPAVSRSRNIGMQGINFDIRDPREAARWESLYMHKEAIAYEHSEPMRITDLHEEW